MTALLTHRRLQNAIWATAILATLPCTVGAGQPEPSSKPSSEIIVSARKFDRRRLDHVIIPRFVRSHSAPTRAIDQLTRWHAPVCPRITGLKPGYSKAVTRRIIQRAQSVGAPTRGVGRRCRVNIEIVFTGAPQQLLDHIAKRYPFLLGSARTPHDATMTHPIQSWYLTGTQAVNGWQPPVRGLNAPPPAGSEQIVPAIAPDTGPDLLPDSSTSAGAVPGGMAGSRLGAGLQSQLLHVLIVVDTRKTASLPLGAVTDYIAMLALTKVASLDDCSELPSILDLLACACAGRTPPDAITAADTAFLKALYASDLDMKLNVEQGEIHDRMLGELERR